MSESDQLSELARDGLLRLFINTAPDGVIVIDARGVILAFSPAAERLFGYRADEVLGRNVSMLMPANAAAHHEDYVRTYLRTGKRRIIGIGREVVARNRAGEEFPIELAVGEMIADGTHIFTGFVRDISARRKMEHRLSALQDELFLFGRFSALGELTITLAHELNQPLSAIANYASAARRLCKAGPDSIARANGLMEQIAAQAGRAGQVIRRIRNFIARRTVERGWHDLCEVVGDSVQLGSMGAERKGISVEIRCAERAFPVFMDRIQIQQVLTNLVRNAVDVLEDWPGARRIIIETACHDKTGAAIRIADTGPGIAPQIAERLFEPFNSSKPDGMGIGLAISRRIIEAHGGRIRAENRKDGGALFEIELPVNDGRNEDQESKGEAA